MTCLPFCVFCAFCGNIILNFPRLCARYSENGYGDVNVYVYGERGRRERYSLINR